MRRFWLVFGLVAIIGLPRFAAAKEVCYPSDKTPHCLNDPFSGYWETNGGLPVFGYPVSPKADEFNNDTQKNHPTQWLERNRFEHHTENAGTPYEVLLGLLGKERLAQLGRNYAAEPREAGPKDGCLWFDQTGHNVCNIDGNLGFKAYWESHGLKISGMNKYDQSLQLFGLPLTEPKMETNSSGDTVLTQWFERARFEWHPNNPAEFKVLLGLLGTEVHGPPSPPPPPPPPPAPKEITILTHSGYMDSIENYWVVGEVKNNLDTNAEFIKIIGTFYDANNNVIGSSFSYTEIDIAKPGQRVPFEMVFSDPPSSLHHYALQVQWRPTNEKPLEGFPILSSGDRDAGFGDARYIFGELRNDSGVTVEYVRIVATLYNAEGTVIGTGFTYTDLDTLSPSQTSPFEMPIFDWSGTARYELQVQARRE